MFGLIGTKLAKRAPLRRQETGGADGGPAPAGRPRGLACGLVAGTVVATAMGWRPVEAVAEGDLVLTFDRGLQPVRGILRGLNWEAGIPCPDPLRPLRVPSGALGNRHAMTLLPEQSVLVESDAADTLFGDPFALVAGAALDGFRGIERIYGEEEREVIQLQFDREEIVFADLGALVFCPCSRMLGIDTLLAAEACEATGYRSLPADEASMLIGCLEIEDELAETAAPAPAPAYAAAFA